MHPKQIPQKYASPLKVLVLLLALVLSSCIVATKNTGIISQSITTTSGQQRAEAKTGLPFPESVAIIPFSNLSTNPNAATLLRGTIYNHLSSKNFRNLHLKDITSRLSAAGLSDPDAIKNATPRELTTILKVDAIMVGEISHYDMIYAGVYSQVAVGLKLRLLNRNGEELWKSEKVVRKHEGGISTTPVGLILQAVMAAIHVREITFIRATDDLAREILTDMPEPTSYATTRPPIINQVVHNGAGRILKYGDTLQVAMEGEPGMEAFARIDGIGLIELIESEPRFYTATISIAPEQNIPPTPLVGILHNKNGQQREWVATLGLVEIDNTAPAPITSFSVTPKDQAVLLEWEGPADQDLAAFNLQISTSEQGPYNLYKTVTDNFCLLEGLTNFSEVYLRLAAIDRAGNQGPMLTISATPLPDARISQAKASSAILPARIEGLQLLTAKGSPYTINDQVELTASASLFIGPGVKILVSAGGGIIVNGELRVYGTPLEPVTVNRNDPTAYTTVLTMDSQKPVVLTGMVINDGAMPLIVKSGAPQFIDCQINNSLYCAMEINGLSKPLIRGSIIQGSRSGAIIVTDKAQPRFENNSFINNTPFHIMSSSPLHLFAAGNTWQPPASAQTLIGEIDY